VAAKNSRRLPGSTHPAADAAGPPWLLERNADVNRLLSSLVAVTALVPASPPVPRNEQAVRAVLAREVDFPGFADSNTTLPDALGFISRQYNLRIGVNEQAFYAAGLPEVLAVKLTENGPIRPRKGVPLDRVLRDVLLRVPVSSCGFDPASGKPFRPVSGKWPFDPLTGLPIHPLDISPPSAFFIVHPTGIEVTTASALWAQKLPPEPPHAVTADQAQRMQAIRAAMAREVAFPGIDDPKTTLEEALAIVSRLYNLHFEVNDEAFLYEQVHDVRKTPVAETALRARKDDQLYVVVRDILSKIPVPSGAVYAVGPNGIEVTTEKFLEVHNVRPEPAPPPTLIQLRRARDLHDNLVRPSQFNGFDDPKMTLDEALEFMTKRYGLRFRVNEIAFRYEQVNEVGKTPIAEQPIPRSRDLVLPGKVLELLLARIPVPSGAVFVVRPQGYVEITTRRFVLAELQGENLIYAGAGK
jgi:hypothetical protein